MKIIVIKSRYITDETEVDLFEGNLDEFITYCVVNFKNWFVGNESSCEKLAKDVIKTFETSNKVIYKMEVASWFRLVK